MRLACVSWRKEIDAAVTYLALRDLRVFQVNSNWNTRLCTLEEKLET